MKLKMFQMFLFCIFVPHLRTVKKSFKSQHSIFPDNGIFKNVGVTNICNGYFNLTACHHRLKRDSMEFYQTKFRLSNENNLFNNNRHGVFKRHRVDSTEKFNLISKPAQKYIQNESFTSKGDKNFENVARENVEQDSYEKSKLQKSNEFKLTIGTIKLSKLRLPRKPTKLKNKFTSYLTNSSSNPNYKFFQGVSSEEEKILNILIANDFQTGIMEFIEMAYDFGRNKNTGKEMAKIKSEGVNDDKQGNKLYGCGYKFTFDLEKIINLNKVFSVQIYKALAFVNILNSALTSTNVFPEQGFYDKMLKSFLFSDNKILATEIILEPSYGNEKGNLNPYVIKTDYTLTDSTFGHVRPIRDPDNILFDHNDYKQLNFNKTSSKRQTPENSKGYEKMNKDYSLKLQQYKNVCMNDYHGKAIKTLKNETLWGYMQSDCAIRRAMSNSQEQNLYSTNSNKWNFNLRGVWTVLYFLPFFGCVTQNTLAFKGVLKVVLDLSSLDFNQCENNNKTFLFNVQHNCPPTTECRYVSGGGFRRGNYKCVCQDLKSFWPETNNSTSRVFLKNGYSDNNTLITNNTVYKQEGNARMGELSCVWTGKTLEDCATDQILNRSHNFDPSALTLGNCSGCSMFFDAIGCPDIKMYEKLDYQQTLQQQQWSEEYNYWMRGLPFGIQCFTILTGLAIVVVVARLKRNKVMKISIWVLLEFSIIGALVLHFSVVILAYFEATPIICLLIPWCREIGFLFLYGSLLLKHQRTLTEFQSRKAHRVQWRDKDLVRCLIIMVIILSFNMAAWTASVSDNLSSIYELTNDIRIEIKNSHSTFPILCRTCQLSLKDRILEAGELAFLGYVVYMCYKVRKAPNEYHENKFITFCIINEILISVLYYSFRYFFNSLWHPDRMFLASFLRCHVTSTVTVMLVVCSKLWYSCWPPSTEYRARSCSSAPSVDSRSVQFLNPSSPAPASPPIQFDTNKPDSNNLEETDISQMTSDDIRYELRKLYTQLQIYKTKTMRQDNPHISKRRGGKKQTNRKFSFQNLHAKYKQQSSVTSTNAAATTPSGSVGGGTSMGGDHCENSTVTGGGEIDLSVRSPEDSSNSMEGVSVYMDENSYASPEVNTSAGKDSYAVKKQQNAFKSILSAARNKSKQTN